MRLLITIAMVACSAGLAGAFGGWGGGGGASTPIATSTVAGKVKPDNSTIGVLSDGTLYATGSSTPGNSIYPNISSALRSVGTITSKTTPVTNDRFGFWDSVANSFRALTWGNLVTALNGLYHGLTVTYAELSDKPTTVAASGISDAQTTTGFNAYTSAAKKRFDNVSGIGRNVPTSTISDNSSTGFPTGATVKAFVSYSCPAGQAAKKNTTGTTYCTAIGSGGGSGTVTTVSVTTANGFQGSVTNPTTSPAISVNVDGSHYLPSTTDQTTWNGKQAAFSTYSCPAGQYFFKVQSTGTSYCATPSTSAGSVAFGAVTGQPTDNTNLATALSGKVSTSTTVNGQALSGNVTVTTITGNAGTATALAANGTNCSAGQAALGVDASGNAEGCFTPTGTYSLPITDSTSTTSSTTAASATAVKAAYDLANGKASPNANTTGSAASLSVSGQTGLITITGITSTNRAKTVRDAADTILELGGSYTPTGTWGWGSATVTWPSILAQDIANNTATLGTSAISSGACASVVTVAGSGIATTDVLDWGFNGDPTDVTGYAPSASGMLTIIAYPTSGNANFKCCNNTASSITPGAVTLNWRVRR